MTPADTSGIVRLSLGGRERNSVTVAQTAPIKARHGGVWMRGAKRAPATIHAARQAALPVKLFPLILVLPHFPPTMPAAGSPTARKVSAIIAMLWWQKVKTMVAAARM